MGLGTNRDYKTNERRVRRNLALHAKIKADLIGLGADAEAAEKQAGEMVLTPVAYFKPLAVVAVDDGIPEKWFLAQVHYPELLPAARKAYRAAKMETA